MPETPAEGATGAPIDTTAPPSGAFVGGDALAGQLEAGGLPPGSAPGGVTDVQFQPVVLGQPGGAQVTINPDGTVKLTIGKREWDFQTYQEYLAFAAAHPEIFQERSKPVDPTVAGAMQEYFRIWGLEAPKGYIEGLVNDQGMNIYEVRAYEMSKPAFKRTRFFRDGFAGYAGQLAQLMGRR